MYDISDSWKNRHGLRIAISALAVLVFALCFAAAPARSHAPSDMSIRYDPDAAKIYVTITHPVDDPKTHYLNKVHVKLSGEVISDPDYKSQPTKDTFTLTYDVNANPGDVIWVTATCVRGGTIEKSYTVPLPVRPTTPAVPQTPAMPGASQHPATTSRTTQAPAGGLLPLIGIAAAFLIRND